MNKFLFLKSTRFWALCLIAIIKVLDTEGILTSVIATGLITILGGFTVIRTVDRNLGDSISGLK